MQPVALKLDLSGSTSPWFFRWTIFYKNTLQNFNVSFKGLHTMHPFRYSFLDQFYNRPKSKSTLCIRLIQNAINKYQVVPGRMSLLVILFLVIINTFNAAK